MHDYTPVLIGGGQYTQKEFSIERAHPPMGIAAEACVRRKLVRDVLQTLNFSTIQSCGANASTGNFDSVGTSSLRER